MFALLDIGSNSVRLGLFEKENCIEKILQTTRLGEGLHQTGMLSAESVNRTLAAMREFITEARERGASQIFAYATEAVRRAENGKDFLLKAQETLGITVDLLSGETEAEAGFTGAVAGDGAILDIGGASTEIAVKKNGAFIYRKSIPVGCVVLKNACGEDSEKLQAYCAEKAKAFLDAPVENLTGIGGTATTIAALAVEMKKYDGAKITGTFISAEKLRSVREFLKEASIEARVNAGVPKGRADLIYGGAVWLCAIVEELSLVGYIASDADNLEGYARMLVKKGVAE